MERNYSPTPATLKPGSIPPESLQAIGRLVRAFAEIEDLITLFICNLAEISESKAVVILQRSNMQRKLEIANQLAMMTNETIYKAQKAAFGPIFSGLLECRNHVAHGVFIGITEEDSEIYYAFLTARTGDPVGASAMQLVASYTASRILECAAQAEASIPRLEKLLKLEPLRQRRHGRSLLPHRKAQNQQSKGKKRRTQPRS